MDAVNRRLGEPCERDERRGYGWPAAVVEGAAVRDLPPSDPALRPADRCLRGSGSQHSRR